MKTKVVVGVALAAAFCGLAAMRCEAQQDIAKFDKNMAVEGVVVTNGVKWIDGRLLPIEGRAFDDVDHFIELFLVLA